MATEAKQSRDSVEDIWGERTPYKHEWPVRVDYKVSKEPEKWIQSACVLCSNGCGMDIGVKDGEIVGVRGRATDRVNKGRLGPKGMNTYVVNKHKDRLTHPMIRKNGKMERATWDEAMSLIVEKSKDIQKRLTSHGIAFYTSGQLFLEEYYALAMVGKAGLNTLHMDGNTRLCTATAAASMRESFGSDGQPGSYTDVDYTDCLFVVGHNIASTQTVLWQRILDRLDGPNPPKLIVVDPRVTHTARRATVHLQPQIGTNLALLNGIQHLMFKNGWINEEWVEKHAVGRDVLAEKVKKYSPEYVSEITKVPVHLILQAAEILGKTKSLLSTALQGVYQSNQATASACAVNNINLLGGHFGRPGSGVYQMNGQPTAQNNRETGCDGEFPAFRNYENPNHMKDLANIWNIDYNKLPHWNQPTHIENMLSFIQAGSIEMFWISGTNPLVSLPNLPRVRELLTKKELFVIAQDCFMNETVAIADVVLPAAMWGEKTGCFTNVDRTVHLSHKAIEPPGEAKSDLEIFLDYGRRMGFKDKNGGPLMPFKTSEEVFEAWKKMSKGRPCDYSAMTYEKLTGGSGIQWPCTEQYPYGKERLFDDGVFFTDTEYCESFGHDLETGAPYTKAEYNALNPNGRAILKACDYIPDLEQVNEEYPIRLSTGRRALHFHTRTKTGRTPALQDHESEPFIRVNREDAKMLEVEEGDMAIVKSRRGAIEMKVMTGDISKGNAFIPFHFGYFDAMDGPARAANELTRGLWTNSSHLAVQY
jgi:ferredoxin-nitrate reductase